MSKALPAGRALKRWLLSSRPTRPEPPSSAAAPLACRGSQQRARVGWRGGCVHQQCCLPPPRRGRLGATPALACHDQAPLRPFLSLRHVSLGSCPRPRQAAAALQQSHPPCCTHRWYISATCSAEVASSGPLSSRTRSRRGNLRGVGARGRESSGQRPCRQSQAP